MIDVSEVEILGRWITGDGQLRADEACQRIEHLTAEYLVRIVNSSKWGDWEILYQNPQCGCGSIKV